MSIDIRRASEKIAELGVLPFFPTEKHARAAIVGIVCDMVATNAQVDWLVLRCLQLWSKWEGPRELRAVFCSKYRPRDGVEAYSQLEQFADGIPSERSQPLLTAPPAALLEGRKTLPDFPTDSLSLLASVAPAEPVKVIRRRAPLPTQAEIDEIKATQNTRRLESEPV